MKSLLNKRNPSWVPFSLKIVSILIAILIWHIISVIISENILLVSPFKVFGRVLTIWREPGFFSSILFSLVRITIGYISGVVLGTILGVLADRFVLVEYLIWPFMISVRSIPVASIVVICLLWLSAANLSWFISFLIVLPVVYNNVLTGLKKRSPELEEAVKVIGAKWLQRVRYVYLPQLLPFLLSACSVTAGMAWKAGVAAEVIGTPNGSIGQNLYLAKIYLDTTDLFTWTLVIVIISVLFEKIFVMIIKRLIECFAGSDN